MTNKILLEDMLYLFIGIEDGWISPSKEDLELYYAYCKLENKIYDK